MLQAKSKAPKPDRRKKWGKSVIQLVPAAPTTQASNADGSVDAAVTENKVNEIDSTSPLKLPRAMRSALTNGNNTLRERNSETSDPVIDLITPPASARSPHRPANTSDGKEN